MGFSLPRLISYGAVPPLTYGVAEEQNTAFALFIPRGLYLPLGFKLGSLYTIGSWRASETDTAFALEIVQSNALAGWWPPLGFKWGDYLGVKVAIEIDTAFDLAVAGGIQGRGLPFGFFLGSSGNFYVVGRANETDTAYALYAVIDALVIEYDIAGEEYDILSLDAIKVRTPGIALESDFAFPLSADAVLLVKVAEELDIALAPSLSVRVVPVGRADDFSFAFDLQRSIGLFVKTAVELDTSYRMAINAQIVAIGDATETNVPFSLFVIKYNQAKVSVEVDSALALSQQSGPQITVYAWRRVT